MSQGRFFDEAEVQRIVSLLASTEMTMGEIAERMSCSRGAVVAINRKWQIRSYSGHRTSWQICPRVQTTAEMTGVAVKGNVD